MPLLLNFRDDLIKSLHHFIMFMMAIIDKFLSGGISP